MRLGLLALAALSGCGGEPSVPPRAAPRGPAGPAAPERGVFRGEVVELACFLRQGARGEAHRPCAAACLKRGSPAGLFTETGELYLLLPPVEGGVDLAAAAGRLCDVEGDLVRRSGMRGVLVRRLTAVPASPAP